MFRSKFITAALVANFSLICSALGAAALYADAAEPACIANAVSVTTPAATEPVATTDAHTCGECEDPCDAADGAESGDHAVGCWGWRYGVHFWCGRTALYHVQLNAVNEVRCPYDGLFWSGYFPD